MWNIPTKEHLDRIPRLYETDDTPLEEKTIYLHFFIGGCDWFVAEYDGDDLFFGFAILNRDYGMFVCETWRGCNFNPRKRYWQR